MRLRFSTTLIAALVCVSGSAFAQSGDLSGVTMRVLDDVSDIDAVVLELDSNRGTGEESADSDDTGDADREAEQGPSARAEEDRLDERDERDELHDPDDDERSEGKLEDNDVERPAVPPPTP
jgi:hypothetical protein